jgi:hypothetical protein
LRRFPAREHSAHLRLFPFCPSRTSRGGDADTNGAITGALLGACYGESAIPARWAGQMLRAHTSKTKEASTDLETLLALADRCAERGSP